MATIVDGKKIAQEMQENLKKKVVASKGAMFFHIIYVGSDPVIDSYMSYKQKYAQEIGVHSVIHRFPEDISEERLCGEIQEIAKKQAPMIVQLPLPDSFDTKRILNVVPKELDVDVLGDEAKEAFKKEEGSYIPPVTGAILKVIEHYDISLDDKKIVLLGNGALVGQPFASWLSQHSLSFKVIDIETTEDEKKNLLYTADIVVCGVGRASILKSDDVSQGVVVIDAGTSESNASIKGDADYSLVEKASLFTPVPGGIGPLTIACLFTNITSYYD